MGTANAQTILNGGLEPVDWPICGLYQFSPPYPPDSVLEEMALLCAGGLTYEMINDCFPYVKTDEEQIAVYHTDCLMAAEIISEDPLIYQYDTVGVPASQGQFYLAIGGEYGSGFFDLFTMKLSETLQQEEWYKLTYDIISASFFAEFLDSVAHEFDSAYAEIGLSNGEYTFGESIHQSDLPTPGWSTQTVVFQAEFDTINYISCRAMNLGVKNGLFIDNFVLSTDTTTVGWQELQKPKQLLRIVDVLGRESKPKPNVPLFYIYTDGTVEKKIVISDSFLVVGY